MTKHTPGPWVADMAPIDGPLDNGNDPLFVFVGSDDDETRTDICDVHSWHGIEQRDANARLIAAAPKMLDALKTIRNQSIGEDWTAAQAIEWAKQFAREIVAEAEGGAS